MQASSDQDLTRCVLRRDGRYDIIGFDPRGTGQTTPRFNCSTSPEQEGWTNFEYRKLPLPVQGRNGSLYPLAEVTAAERYSYEQLAGLAQAMVSGCEKTGNVDVITSASTAFAARDMNSVRVALGEDKLHYWGLSYGTVIGAQFAAMFPDKVGRLVLDGT